MAKAEPAAFWSYSHEDDDKSRGRIVELAALLRDEYSLLTGEELALFVDRDIQWGEEWRQRIEHALVATTFFIPIVTPRYFAREECLRELFEFSQRATGLGVSELVCPLLYVPVDDLNETSNDAAKALVARAQYEDWTQLRLRGPDSADHIEAVHGLAVRLAGVADRVGKRQVAQEARQDEGGEVEASLAETVQALRHLLPEWNATCEADSVELEKLLAADRVLEARREKSRTGPAGARFVIAARQVQEYLPFVERRRELGERLVHLATEIGPLLTRMFTIIREHPEERGVMEEVWQEIRSASDAYLNHEEDMIRVGDWARRHSHETRGMLTLAKACDRADRLIMEVGAQNSAWESEHDALVDELAGS